MIHGASLPNKGICIKQNSRCYDISRFGGIFESTFIYKSIPYNKLLELFSFVGRNNFLQIYFKRLQIMDKTKHMVRGNRIFAWFWDKSSFICGGVYRYSLGHTIVIDRFQTYKKILEINSNAIRKKY